VKIFDISGSESTKSIVLQLTLLLEKTKGNKAAGVLKSLSGFSDNGKSCPSALLKSSSSLAALALSLKVNPSASSKQGMTGDQVTCWMKPLAPSLQRSKITSQSRQRIIGEKDLENLGEKGVDLDTVWSTPCNESRHVW
jgi:hypothetical protein